MVFKLVRTDTAEPCKIELPLGKHLVGRGKFLDCEDKRVSRNHGELEVTDDSVTIKALHQNPCFFIKKGTSETQILKRNGITNLSHGDKFGLLPDSYWYELLLCTMLDSNKLPEIVHQENDRDISNTDRGGDEEDAGNNLNDSNEPLNFDSDKTVANGGSESPSLLHRTASPSHLQPDSQRTMSPQSQSLIPPENQDSPTQDYNVTETESSDPQAPAVVKRSHSPSPADGTGDVKKIKTEPEDVKKEPEDAKPGPSNDQAGQDASKADDNSKDDMPSSPQKAQNAGPGRERCMYGANCYRKNPQHKAQFSHPGDQDWGTGDRAPCPWGRGCRRADPRHWRDHDHPPGVQPPQNRPAGQRRKKKRSDSGEDSPATDLIVTGKRARKTIQRQGWSGSESENEDPFQTDESDEWEPGSDTENTQSQGFTQDI